ncbi:anti-sigma factor family protein [Millisia brevis]|uniref:anti-sigma factor family protein n=1 Tax=Millisia brevis TaxID=264148 RepID=UPI00082A3FB6|nr:zf-HC2 domain-containing protein [Millisia brevis]
MTQVPGRTKFGSTEHLAAEAIVAYVDNELPLQPYLRAAAHLAACPECVAEVEAQRQARGVLQQSTTPSMPAYLYGTLSRIPETTPQASLDPDTQSAAHRLSGLAGFVGFRLRRR